MVQKFSFGTIWIDGENRRSALERLLSLASARRGGYITLCNTHSVVESERDPILRNALNAATVNLPDGMPTVWVGKSKGIADMERVDGPGLLEAVIADARAKQLKHYFYGSSPETLKRVVANAMFILGSDAIVGSYSPPIRAAGAEESSEVLAAIVSVQPHVLWVGLGLPKQEYWMAQHAPLLPGTTLVGIGAAFDWFAGTKPRAPKMMRETGFEWLFRLASEPRRLWRRYALVIPRALALMLREFTSRR